MIQGKGFFIWQVWRCEGQDISAVADLATRARFSHVLVKVADGASPYNITGAGDDLAQRLVRALHERNILAVGWHYIYGYDPLAEANIAIQRAQTLGLDGYVLDVEAPYKQTGREQDARVFMSRLRELLPDLPVGLSSYRYPTYHPQIPWEAFLEKCDYNMPQVYWLQAHNPGDQLVRSVREFQNIAPFRPIIPTGAAFKQGDWLPSVSDVEEFLRVAQNLNLSGANFWEWAHCRQYLPEIWDTIETYPWALDASNLDIVDRYIAALNAHDPDRVLDLYHPRSVLVTSQRTIQGVEALKGWFQDLFNRVLPAAVFSLEESTGSLGSRTFSWRATANPGRVNDGSDSFGLVDKKITYHYTHFTVT